jgi:hypothetical protein
MDGRTSKFVIRHGDDCLDASGGRFVCMRDETNGLVQQHWLQLYANNRKMATNREEATVCKVYFSRLGGTAGETIRSR